MRSTTSSLTSAGRREIRRVCATHDRRRRGGSRGKGLTMKVEVKFLAFYARTPWPSIRHCFSCGSWLAWRNNTKLKTPDQRGLIGARLIFNKNYGLVVVEGGEEGKEKERARRALRLKNSPVPRGTRWRRNLKLRKLRSRATGWARRILRFCSKKLDVFQAFTFQTEQTWPCCNANLCMIHELSHQTRL